MTSSAIIAGMTKRPQSSAFCTVSYPTIITERMTELV